MEGCPAWLRTTAINRLGVLCPTVPTPITIHAPVVTASRLPWDGEKQGMCHGCRSCFTKQFFPDFQVGGFSIFLFGKNGFHLKLVVQKYLKANKI